MARRFYLHRRSDISGISGIGVVAEGVEFNDGVAVVRWLSSTKVKKPSTVVFDDIQAVIDIHGHDGATEVVWSD